MKHIFYILASLLMVSCTTKPQIISVGQNRYLYTKQRSTGFETGDMRPEAISEAKLFCEEKKQSFEMIELKQNEGPYVLGNYPRADLQFLCITKDQQFQHQPWSK